MAEIIAKYTATLDGSGKKRATIAEERRYGLWWTAKLAGLRLNALTADQLDGIKRELTLQGLEPQTVVHYMKYPRHVLYAVIGKSKLVDNPFDVVKLPKIRPRKTRFLTPDEELTLCHHIGVPYASWVRLAILTGLRREEQLSLRWAEIDLEKGLICLPDTKTDGAQYVPLNERAKGILRQLHDAQLERGWLSEWVFPSKNPTRHLNADNFYGRIFMPAVRAAKLEGVTWHTLRHTFASRLAMSGQNAITIAELLRHSGLELVRRYSHLSPAH